jgi:hypothetical protein
MQAMRSALADDRFEDFYAETKARWRRGETLESNRDGA